MPKMSRSNNELVGEPVFATKLFFSVFVCRKVDVTHCT